MGMRHAHLDEQGFQEIEANILQCCVCEETNLRQLAGEGSSDEIGKGVAVHARLLGVESFRLRERRSQNGGKIMMNRHTKQVRLTILRLG